ncbi:hypothetical protein GJV11_03545 [Enterobacteriaceae bacterium RIT693]|jgi:hypothetical protein|nr:hypothetical protein [Enterobacteriaceae bacterium RIT693]
MNSTGISSGSQAHSVSMLAAHDYLPPEALRLSGKYRNQVMNVSPRTMGNLNLASQTQDGVVRYMPHGAGNQWLSVVGSKGESYLRAHLAREDKKAIRDTLRTQAPNMDRTYASGRTAATLQGGNCQEFADLAYTMLAARGSSAPVSSAMYRNDHVLVMIGDPRESNKTAMVDAWQHIPVATLLSNTALNPNELVVKKQYNSRQGDPDAQYALSGITPVPKNVIEQRMAKQGFHGVGSALVKDLAEGLKEQHQLLYDVRTLAADPGMRYNDGQVVKSFDSMRSDQLTKKIDSINQYSGLVSRQPGLYGPSKGL